MLFRTEAQKLDLEWNWNRGDRAFFQSGACHILTFAFLEHHTDSHWKPWMIKPREGFRGEHIFAATENVVFDYHGFSNREKYIEHYFRKIRRLFPKWEGELLEVAEFMTPQFFKKHNYRAPHQYFRNPIPRADAFINRLKQKRAIE